MKKNKKTVFVGMSGGVDSSVSVALLKEQGYNVVGVFIRTWHPEFLECNEEEERRDAMRVAAHLNIPFLTFDFEDVYKKEVADYMIAEYKVGRTPNPDVMCNKEVKFGAFLKKAISMGADYVATGHYAKRRNYPEKSPDIFLLKNSSRLAPSRSVASFRDNFCLLKGLDGAKDQSYFLWTLKQNQLSKIIFPVGHLNKTEVRKLAKKFRLPVAEKKDSQGICFLGAVDLKDFLKHYVKEKKGKVLDEKGNAVGWHNGAIFYTLGERHGFTITEKSPTDNPYYIIGKDVKKNILYVSQGKSYPEKSPNKKYIEKKPDKNSKNFPAFALGGIRTGDPRLLKFFNFYLELKNTNWISEIPKENKIYTAQIRYHGKFLPCKVKIISKAKTKVFFKESILVAPGQSCVIYDREICLGGGVVV